MIFLINSRRGPLKLRAKLATECKESKPELVGESSYWRVTIFGQMTNDTTLKAYFQKFLKFKANPQINLAFSRKKKTWFQLFGDINIHPYAVEFFLGDTVFFHRLTRKKRTYSHANTLKVPSFLPECWQPMDLNPKR